MIIDRLGAWSFGEVIGSWWPVLLVVLGLMSLRKGSSSMSFGLILTFIGLFILGSNLDIIPLGFWDMFWPLLLIIIGIALLSRYSGSRRQRAKDQVDIFSVFSGAEEKYTTDEFKGGSVFAMFGGAELDLTDSMLPPEGASMDVTVLFGGADIYVPENWIVKTKGLPLFGGCTNKTTYEPDPDLVSPVLEVNYTAMFGGVEVSNKRKSRHYS